MSLGGSFSLQVSRSGLEVMFLVFIQVAICTSKRLYGFLAHCYSLQFPGCYSRECRSGHGFGLICCKRILQLRPFHGTVEN